MNSMAVAGTNTKPTSCPTTSGRSGTPKRRTIIREAVATVNNATALAGVTSWEAHMPTAYAREAVKSNAEYV
jgi:hypothetical protein